MMMISETPPKKSPLKQRDGTNLGIVEDRVIVDAGKEDFHDVGLVVQRRNAQRLQIGRQIRHVRLQFGEGYRNDTERGKNEISVARNPFRAGTTQ